VNSVFSAAAGAEAVFAAAGAAKLAAETPNFSSKFHQISKLQNTHIRDCFYNFVFTINSHIYTSEIKYYFTL